MLFRLACKSLLNRKITVLLTGLSIAVSILVLLGVEHIRHEAKSSFGKTVSGVDLIVGARTGQLNLLLYSVFRIGHATNNISWDSYQQLANHPQVAWTIPLSLGDSHRGYRVVGTTTDYFTHFRYGQARALAFAEGEVFNGVLDLVLGAAVASKLGLQLGDSVVLAHGTGSTSFSLHDDKPFLVTGILHPTGTPVDQTLHVSLAGIEAIHHNWQPGSRRPAGRSASEISAERLTPSSITAFMVGLKSRISTFQVQRQVNDFRAEPLTAILPGVALAELWQMMAAMENILRLISLLVLLASLLGLSTMLLASMRERQRELAVLRAIGAGPLFILLIVQLEAVLIVLLAAATAVIGLWAGLELSRGFLSEHYGVFINTNLLNPRTLQNLLMIFLAAFLVGLLPAISAYRTSLHNGLSVRH